MDNVDRKHGMIVAFVSIPLIILPLIALKGLSNMAAESILPNDEIKYAYREYKLNHSTILDVFAEKLEVPPTIIECPGHSIVSAMSTNKSLTGAAYPHGNGVLKGSTLTLSAESGSPAKLPDKIYYNQSEGGDRTFRMGAEIPCPLEVNTPIVTSGRLEMPVLIAQYEIGQTVNGLPLGSQGFDWREIQATSEEIPYMLISRETGRTFQSIKNTEDQFNDFVPYGSIWSCFLFGVWAAVVSATIRGPRKDLDS
jgi:hypothetical protein